MGFLVFPLPAKTNIFFELGKIAEVDSSADVARQHVIESDP